MKKLFIIISMISALVMSGCSSFQGDEGRLRIVTTIFPQFDFVRAIAGDKADITLLIKPGNETHTYDPTPKEAAVIAESDLFIWTGSESESWVETVTESAGLSDERKISLFSLCEVEEEEHDHEHEELDEHVWTSPANAILITEGIRDRLCEIDPDNADHYRENAESYIRELKELDSYIEEIVDSAENKTVVFGDRFPARYFAERYGISYLAAYPGCSTDSEPSSASIASIIETVKAENIPVVFHIEFSNEETADIICEATGAKKLLFHSCHNISAEDFETGKTYVDIMKQNAENLKEALS